jgi:hypothetical protein
MKPAIVSMAGFFIQTIEKPRERPSLSVEGIVTGLAETDVNRGRVALQDTSDAALDKITVSAGRHKSNLR